MKCYNCERTADLKEWNLPGPNILACKECSQYFRNCMLCSMSVDLNDYDTHYEILGEDKILCDKVICYWCVKDGNLPKEYVNKQSETKNIKLENELKKTVRKKKITKKK